MLPFHPLASAVQADREREIRDRSPLRVGLPSGPRHPTRPESDAGAMASTGVPEARRAARSQRVASGSPASG